MQPRVSHFTERTNIMVVQVVRFASPLDLESLLEVSHKRAPLFEKLPGLVQKYYCRTSDGEKYAGIYIWDSRESLEQFRASELAASIPQAYKLEGPPEIETYEVQYSLR
jgi:heme-degrading monooxygenase HmoA